MKEERGTMKEGVMNSDAKLQDSSTPPLPKSKDEVVEGIAFTFCKTCTLVLLTLPLGQFALPTLTGVTALLFVAAAVQGQKESRCVLKKSWLIAAFWGGVCAVTLYLRLRPSL